MFTLRKIFSSSLDISAARGDETRWMCSGGTSSAEQRGGRLRARRRRCRRRPSGCCGRRYRLLPGSIRSGEKARRKSAPGRRPGRLQDGADQFLGGAGVRGGLEDHQRTRRNMGCQRTAGALDEGEIGRLHSVKRSRHADHDGVGLGAPLESPCSAEKRPACTSGASISVGTSGM